MADWKTRNPGADRRMWNEPRRRRGRTLIWLAGVPLLVAVLGVANVAAAHIRLNLDFGPQFGTVASPTPREPLVLVPASTPAAATAKPARSHTAQPVSRHP
jgi:hypothetical protein